MASYRKKWDDFRPWIHAWSDSGVRLESVWPFSHKHASLCPLPDESSPERTIEPRRGLWVGAGNTPWSPVINNPRSSIFTAHNTANHLMIHLWVLHAQDCPSRLLKGWCSPVVCPGSWLLFAGSALPVYGVASCPLSIAWPRPLPMRVSEDAVLCSYPGVSCLVLLLSLGVCVCVASRP